VSHDAHTENLQVVEGLIAFDGYAVGPRTPADVVMKGGITSGVVYPLAVCELAKEYAFRNVGGSSAGGIAAAFAAAAETARASGGFNRLAELPAELGGRLSSLFQPAAGTRGLFEVFRAATSRRSGAVPKPLRLIGVLVRRQPVPALLAAVLTAALAAAPLMLAGARPDAGSLWPLVPLVAVAALLGALVGTSRSALRELPRNGHGLCIGSRGAATPREPLPFTDWMSERLATVAGCPGEVLTFGDLWGPDAVRRYWKARPDDAERREAALAAADPQVRLEMMTTNLTQARPVRLPFVQDIYLYCEQELARWFPPAVMTALAVGEPAVDPVQGPWLCPEHGTPLRKLPHPPDLPVVVAVRMTLSFPLLISAVPLWVIDFTAVDPAPVHCRFSDGGISSNFPIHFFDTLLPSRPTFAISLGPYPPGREHEDVYYAGRVGAPPRTTPTETVGQFAGALLNTLQNWSDNGQSGLPGYRDRIVEVRHSAAEGGLNLDMDETTILDLAVRGRDAATELRLRFDFPRHRVLRYRTAMAELQEAVTAMAARYDAPLADGAPGYRAVARSLGAGAMRRTDLLLAFVGRQPGRAGTVRRLPPDFTRRRPRPDPDLRIVAHF
jgi:predicted acylesterase/phospholipase RssA